ncbi:ribbon-helix-helix protein, CopG family [Acidianus manzaensis]|nr:ribbon-helix-helix protein, CopG family [Acidianus manzaensis]
MMKRKAVITYIDEDIYNKLLKMAEIKGSSVSQVVREIILERVREWQD